MVLFEEKELKKKYEVDRAMMRLSAAAQKEISKIRKMPHLYGNSAITKEEDEDHSLTELELATKQLELYLSTL